LDKFDDVTIDIVLHHSDSGKNLKHTIPINSLNLINGELVIDHCYYPIFEEDIGKWTCSLLIEGKILGQHDFVIMSLEQMKKSINLDEFEIMTPKGDGFVPFLSSCSGVAIPIIRFSTPYEINPHLVTITFQVIVDDTLIEARQQEITFKNKIAKFMPGEIDLTQVVKKSCKFLVLLNNHCLHTSCIKPFFRVSDNQGRLTKAVNFNRDYDDMYQQIMKQARFDQLSDRQKSLDLSVD